jgi:hypothetical protein
MSLHIYVMQKGQKNEGHFSTYLLETNVINMHLFISESIHMCTQSMHLMDFPMKIIIQSVFYKNSYCYCDHLIKNVIHPFLIFILFLMSLRVKLSTFKKTKIYSLYYFNYFTYTKKNKIFI